MYFSRILQIKKCVLLLLGLLMVTLTHGRTAHLPSTRAFADSGVPYTPQNIPPSCRAAGQSVIKLVPKPAMVKENGSEVVLSSTPFLHVYAPALLSKDYIKSVFEELGITTLFLKHVEKKAVIFRIDQQQKGPEGAYVLDIASLGTGGILIKANSKQGLLNGMQSLRQLVIKDQKGAIRAPSCLIEDEPKFSWRAFMLDESRHFQGAAVVKKLLDEMARLKFNTFHWHLVDDPGWRIEIKKYPLLTQTGSKRDFSHREISGQQWDSLFPGRKMFYTQNELKEIVRYADERGIRIIPEIEVPGHASASIYAYPWLGASSGQNGKPVWGDLYNITDPKVETFIQYVLNEVMAIFPSKIIHIGGDEADYTHWKGNAAIVTFMKDHKIPTFSDLQVWSINRLSRYLSSKGVRMIGWNEITGDNIRGDVHIKASESEKLAPGTIVQFWDGALNLVNKAIASGFDVVNSNRHFTYLDYDYKTTSLQKAYSFDPVPEGLTEQNAEKILGFGCQMWGEFTPDTQRLYYQVFPRIAALAECGWVTPEKKDYTDFLKRIQPLEALWKQYGYLKQEAVVQ